jgi:hypothetical protein
MSMRRETTLSYYYSTMSITVSPKFRLGSCILFLLAIPSEGWITTSVSRYSYASPHIATTTTRISPTKGIGMDTDLMRLDASSSPLPDEIYDDEDDDDDVLSVDTQPRTTYRAECYGVSVHETGFWVILRLAEDAFWPDPDLYWPMRVTTSVAATSPEALTLLQLLEGVDLAEAILAPEILARIIVGACDELDDNQSRIRLPVCTLDEIVYHEISTSRGAHGGIWEYECQVQDVGPQTVIPTCNVLQKVACSDVDPVTAAATAAAAAAAVDEETDHEPCGEQAAFFALALALRYQAPIRLSLIDDLIINCPLLSHDQVVEEFPLYRSRDTNGRHFVTNFQQ